MKKIVLICLLCSISTTAQVICDTLTKTPIENVTVVSNDDYGTITNSEGVFALDYFEGNKILKLSHLGFQSKVISINTIKKTDTIYLKPAMIYLDEVVLGKFNAKDTILKVINKISVNYSFKPFNLYGFYRQSLTENNIGVSMTEVSFIAENSGINSKQIYETKIIKGRRSENYTAFGLDIIGGVLSIIQQGDRIRQRKGVFNVENMPKYNFEYNGSIENPNGEVIYIIAFEPANDDIYTNNFGQLFIDSKTLAVVEFNSSRDKEKQKKIIENIDPEIFKSKKAVYVLQSATGVVKYRKINDKYYLSFIDVFNTKKGTLKGESYEYEMNVKLIITNVSTNNIATIKTNYNPRKGFNKQVKKIPSLDYWDENNILYFTVKERKILKDIKNVHE